MVVLYVGLVLLYVCRTNSSPVRSSGGCRLKVGLVVLSIGLVVLYVRLVVVL